MSHEVKEGLMEIFSKKIIENRSFFKIKSTLLAEAFLDEVSNFAELNSLNSLKTEPSEVAQVNMMNSFRKKTKVDIDNEEFKAIWKQASKVKIMDSILRSINDCQTIFAYYKTGNLDLMKANCDTLIAFKQIFKICNIISESLINQLMNKEIKRVENAMRESMESLNSNLALKAKLLNHPKIILAEKMSI